MKTKTLKFVCWNCGEERLIEVDARMEVNPEETISCKRCLRNVKLKEVI